MTPIMLHLPGGQLRAASVSAFRGPIISISKKVGGTTFDSWVDKKGNPVSSNAAPSNLQGEAKVDPICRQAALSLMIIAIWLPAHP